MKRKRISPEERQQHLEAFKASGLSRTEWCKNNNINYHRFTAWQRNLDKKPKSFVALQVSPPSRPGKDYGQIEIQYPVGVKVMLPAGTSPAYILSLIPGTIKL